MGYKGAVTSTELRAFPDGGYPTANLIADSVGNLYSTTTTDGNSNCGTVFKLATLGQTSPTLHSFSCQPDGSIPKAGLLPATRTGNLYGTTSGGGTSNFGTVFEVNANTGMEAVLYSFTGGADGATPVGGLITDQAGNLYGTTTAGGNGNNGAGDGVVFKLNIAMRQETVLHTFAGPDGANPTASLVRDSNRNLYGTTQNGGTHGVGTAFELGATGALTLLHRFGGGRDGAYPYASLVRDSKGRLYGVAAAGGVSGCFNGCGTIFVIIP